jgi:hypothetical protein
MTPLLRHHTLVLLPLGKYVKVPRFSLMVVAITLFSLFFDRASERNTGVAGASGILYDPKGNRFKQCTCSLGMVSNDLAKAYSLLCGIIITKGDSI